MLARIFLNAPQMSDQDASLGGTGTGSTTISTKSWARARQEPDFSNLTPRAQSIRLQIGEDLENDYRLNEIARKLKQSPSWVLERLNQLRSEITLQTAFLPLTDGEYATLRESIAEHGVQAPLVLGEYGIIDGRHRWQVCKELGIEDIPVVFIQGKSEDEEHDLSISLNIARRHLDLNQKKEIARSELHRNFARSDRSIAGLCGLNHETVGVIRGELRREMELADKEPTAEQYDLAKTMRHPDPLPKAGKTQVAEIATSTVEGKVEYRQGVDGKTYSVLVPKTKPAPQRKYLGFTTCPHGEVTELYLEDGRYIQVSSRD